MLANRVKETTSTTGTGSFTTTGAASGFQTFNTAFGTNRRFTYWAVNDTDNEWETGVGYLSASTTLVRETVLDNHSNTTSAVNFTTAPSLFSAANENTLVPSFPPVPANTKLASLHIADGGKASLPVTADFMYLVPFLWVGSQSFDTIGISFGTVAGTKARLGIYSIAPDGFTDELVAETGDITPVSSSHVTGSITALSLPTGWYYTAFLSDGADTVVCWDYNSVLSSPFGRKGGEFNYSIDYARVDVGSGWTSLPSTVSAFKDLKSNANIPLITVEVA